MNKASNIKLTHFSSGAGWACKIGAKELTQVLSKLNTLSNDNNESGFENFDDCAIYRLNERQSIIQTVDFFTPIVDDPYTFGLIAAANSLSDIYAMGGQPLFALNIVAFPTVKINLSVLTEILKGGRDKCAEVRVNILGGHSIKDDSPKYGLAVTGIIDNDKILKNSSAKNNDVLILTKPLGTGIITTAIKNEKANNRSINNVIKLMTTLNNQAPEIIISSNIKVNACTDITGYGLLGHLNEICSSSNLTANISLNNIDFLSGVKELAAKGTVPGGTKNNLSFYKEYIKFGDGIKTFHKHMLADAQTAGGLLIALPKQKSKLLLDRLNSNSKYTSKIIGYLSEKSNNNILVSEWKKYI